MPEGRARSTLDQRPDRSGLDRPHVAHSESTVLPTTQDPPEPLVTDLERGTEALVGATIGVAEDPVVVARCRDGVVDPPIASAERMVVLDPTPPTFDGLALVADDFGRPT